MKNLKLMVVNPYYVGSLLQRYVYPSSCPLLFLGAFYSVHLPVSTLEIGSYHREMRAFLTDFCD